MCLNKFPKYAFLIILINLCCIAYSSRNDQKKFLKTEFNHLIRHNKHKTLRIEYISEDFASILDTSCIFQGSIKAPLIENGRVIKYLQSRAPLTIKKFFVAVYECSEKYHFEIDQSNKMYCSKKTWIGQLPVCIKNIQKENVTRTYLTLQDDEDMYTIIDKIQHIQRKRHSIKENQYDYENSGSGDYSDVEDDYEEVDYKENINNPVYEEEKSENEPITDISTNYIGIIKENEIIKSENTLQTTLDRNKEIDVNNGYDDISSSTSRDHSDLNDVSSKNQHTYNHDNNKESTYNADNNELLQHSKKINESKNIDFKKPHKFEDRIEVDNNNDVYETHCNNKLDNPDCKKKINFNTVPESITNPSFFDETTTFVDDLLTTTNLVYNYDKDSITEYIGNNLKNNQIDAINNIQHETTTNKSYNVTFENGLVDNKEINSNFINQSEIVKKIDNNQEDYDGDKYNKENTFPTEKYFALNSTNIPSTTTETKIALMNNDNENVEHDDSTEKSNDYNNINSNQDNEQNTLTEDNTINVFNIDDVTTNHKIDDVQSLFTTKNENFETSTISDINLQYESTINVNFVTNENKIFYDFENTSVVNSTTPIYIRGDDITTSQPVLIKIPINPDFNNTDEEYNYETNYEDYNFVDYDNTKKDIFPNGDVNNKNESKEINVEECSLGFIHDPSGVCVDIDECAQNLARCPYGCENTIGSYKCTCLLGYFSSSDPLYTCLDTNECEDNPCSHICVNEIGSFHCECPENYYLINETSCNEIRCSHGYNKTNDSVECLCPQGFVLSDNKYTCEDIDECITREHNCSQICENSYGSFGCFCESGYQLQGDGTTCEDIDECEYVVLNNCTQNCINLDGSYKCECQSGFEMNEFDCEDINECLTNNGYCSHICINAEGSFECTCPANYKLDIDNRTCSVLNPCEVDNGGCSDICRNINGNAVCDCHSGFKLNGKICVFIDLCEINNGQCSHHCETVNGNIRCYCPINHELANSTHCIEKNSCLENNGNCSHICKFFKGQVHCDCPDTLRLKGNFCIDPCNINNGGCSHLCVYENNEIKCKCPDNHILKENTCVLIDPCKSNNGGCSHVCKHINGIITCKCPVGFKLLGRDCLSKNSCLVDNGGCSHTCTESFGHVVCSCPVGYDLKNMNCVKLDDSCSLNNGGCSHYCNKKEGHVKCSCPRGYILRPNNKVCKEINKCKRNRGGCSHGCRNLIESYECVCPRGYMLDNTNKTCYDVNECLHRNGGCDQLCTNYKGGYKCACLNGYSIQNDGRSCRLKRQQSYCPILQAPENGKVRCLQMYPLQENYVPVGTQCLIWCDIGYTLRGSSIKTCEYSGNWDQSKTTCEAISCQKLGYPNTGYFTPNFCNDRRSFPGEVCNLHCDIGYAPAPGFETITCLSNLQWSSIVSKEHLLSACIKTPFIKCPSGGYLNYTLEKGQNKALVTIPKPESNVDWWQYVSSDPAWGKLLYNYLSPGRTDVIYTAQSPTTNTTVNCRLIITVIDNEAPQVLDCPSNSEHLLLQNQNTKVIHWSEPKFTDNVGIDKIYKSHEPGTTFSIGNHYVYYKAYDEAGNKAECHITISIKRNEKGSNVLTHYKTVLVCPHGIQYISNSISDHNKEKLKQQGCYWTQVRTTKKPMLQNNYRSHLYQNADAADRSNANRRRYEPLHLYNQCC